LRVGHTRFLDEDHINGGLAPTHMNVLPLTEALEHLSKTNWRSEVLKDPNFLPLGRGPSA